MKQTDTTPDWIKEKLQREKVPTLLGWIAALLFFITIVMLQSTSIQGDLKTGSDLKPFFSLLGTVIAALIRIIWLKHLDQECA